MQTQAFWLTVRYTAKLLYWLSGTGSNSRNVCRTRTQVFRLAVRRRLNISECLFSYCISDMDSSLKIGCQTRAQLFRLSVRHRFNFSEWLSVACVSSLIGWQTQAQYLWLADRLIALWFTVRFRSWLWLAVRLRESNSHTDLYIRSKVTWLADRFRLEFSDWLSDTGSRSLIGRTT